VHLGQSHEINKPLAAVVAQAEFAVVFPPTFAAVHLEKNKIINT